MHSYLSKKKRYNREITNIRLECQRLHQKYHRISTVRTKLITCLLMLIDDPLCTNRRITWSHSKNDKWWTEIVPDMTERQFKDNFRLQRSTFSALIYHIGPYIQKKDTILRPSIPVQKRIAVALYALGSTSELRTIGNLFGIGKNTAGLLLHEFCCTLVDILFHRFIKFPNTDQEIKDTIDDFQTKYGYPMCLGALDGSHISIKPPLGFEIDYFNYKKHHSVILLAVVNASLQFIYVNVGAPGRSNDSSVFGSSKLAEVIQHQIYSNHFMMINNVKIQSHLIADSAFALSKTLMKPFPERLNMPRRNTLFNYRLSRCRCTVERAFGSLKNRFRLLHKKMEFKLDNLTTIIKAATILHNLCIIEGDNIEIDWEIPQPIHKKPACNVQTTGGGDVREAMTDFFLQNPL
jgi:hypothetical protein